MRTAIVIAVLYMGKYSNPLLFRKLLRHYQSKKVNRYWVCCRLSKGPQ